MTVLTSRPCQTPSASQRMSGYTRTHRKRTDQCLRPRTLKRRKWRPRVCLVAPRRALALQRRERRGFLLGMPMECCRGRQLGKTDSTAMLVRGWGISLRALAGPSTAVQRR
jgi:hypothetical protein